MEQFALTKFGETVGEVQVEEEGLYEVFHARFFQMPDGLHWVYAVGSRGSMRLGVLEQQGSEGVLLRRLSKQMLRPIGTIQAFRLGDASVEVPWTEIRLGTTWWSKLSDTPGSKTKVEGTRRLLAVPYQPQKPFPLMGFFCFCKPIVIQEIPYLMLILESDQEIVAQI